MVASQIFFAALALVASVSAQTCSQGNKCPANLPCCSQYGACGVGAYCLGGCDPRSSNTLDSCVPAPVCKSQTFEFHDNSGLTSINKYLGDPSTTNWVVEGNGFTYQDTLLLTMAQGTSGTVVASSTYLWYGNVKARFKTSRGKGVVTAFILLSDVKDEIDYEFVGVDLVHAQSNYYFQGVPLYTHSSNAQLSDTFNNFHTYEIKWTPDSITWLIDDQIARVVNRKDTWNSTANQWYYPQTPARIQLSIWPAGTSQSGAGTIAWAGGLVDWNSADIQTNGYYYAQFDSVTIECYNATSPPGTNLHTSYTYNSYSGTNDSVVDGNKPTVLKSLLGTGTNLTADYASQGGASATSDIAVIPGLSGAGPGTNGHSNDASSSVAAPVATGLDSASTCSSFCQNAQTTGKSDASVIVGEPPLKGSIFAGIIAMAVLLAL